MNPVIRATAIYFFVLLVFRIMGKRSLSQATTFDFVFLLIIGEATQQALLGDDFSITTSFIVISTLVSIELVLTWAKDRFKRFDHIAEGIPLLLVADGKLLDKNLKKAEVGVDDVLEAGRSTQGFERLDQIKYAVLEKNGEISIVGY